MSTSTRRRATFTDRRFAFRMPSPSRVVWLESVSALSAATAVALGISPAVAIWSLAVIAVLPFVAVAGRGVIDWLWTIARFVGRRVPDFGSTTHRTENDGRSFGVHWHGRQATCVLELAPPRGVVTKLGRSEARTDSLIDLAVLAECLRQHDISLSGIGVVSHGTRTDSGSPATDVYERLIGPLPAVATRRVWISVSLDIGSNRLAIDARGGGRTGAARAIGIATERVSRALAGSGTNSRVLTSADIGSMASTLCRGVDADALTESWSAAPLPGVSTTGYGLDARRLDSAVLADVWSVPSVSTTVSLRLTPGTGPDTVRVDGECRFVSRGPRPAPHIPGAVSMNGRHRESLLTSLPLGITAFGHEQPVREMSYERIGRLRLPVSGCGQLVGSDIAGLGIAVRVHGPDLATVLVSGELYLAQQVVFRAVATGARILIRTDRTHAWAPLVDSVATPDRLSIEGGPFRTDVGFDVVVHDYVDASLPADRRPHDGVTTMILTEHLPRTPMPDPDLSIVQPGATGDRVFVRTGSADIELVLVTIAQETAFIGRPRSVRPVPAAQPG
ncbi:type VII secretion protein EccE [Rhodococcoides kyotonense]|uniref:Type VII secretion protein EccE n=1 Tax=Rhodococcoides kyotonense TaxID=398843 RepID=A0A239MRP0_9NOCA|nr:type VII secretion protein EccE [Rhodococcus kyotonensis]SNT44519.1 type VII secretion protein EccE [Rhodococcus kyotonensis]